MRLVKNKSFSYGKQSFSVEAMTKEQVMAVCAMLDANGWKDSNTDCLEDTGYDGEGYSMEYCIYPIEEQEFKAAFKEAKKKLK